MKAAEGLLIAAWDTEDMEYRNGARGISQRQDRYVRWRAPRVWDREPFGNSHRLPDRPGVVYRYPAQEDTDVYFEDMGTYSESESSDNAMALDD